MIGGIGAFFLSRRPWRFLAAYAFVYASLLALVWRTHEEISQPSHAVPAATPSVSLLDAQMRRIRNEWERLIVDTKASNDTKRPQQRFLPHAIPRTLHVVPREAITISTHMSVSKMDRLVITAKRWGSDGPISAAIYLSTTKDMDDLESYLQSHGEDLRTVTFHVLLEVAEAYLDEEGIGLGYPYNYLRNLAMEHMDTEYFVALDLDMVTLPSGHSRLQAALARHSRLTAALKNKTLMVLPTFNYEVNGFWMTDEELAESVHLLFPNNREEAVLMFGQGRLAGFHIERFWLGHGPTNYTRWSNLSESVEEDAFFGIRYRGLFEPYVLGYYDKEHVRPYNVSFRGFGYDKIVWYMEMFCAGYTYGVIRDAFLVHLPHPRRVMDKKVFEKKTDLIIGDFYRYLESTYQCTKALDFLRWKLREMKVATENAQLARTKVN